MKRSCFFRFIVTYVTDCFILLRTVFSEMDAEVQNKVVVLDPLMSAYLRDPQMSYVTILQVHSDFFSGLNRDTRLIILPYHEAYVSLFS